MRREKRLFHSILPQTLLFVIAFLLINVNIGLSQDWSDNNGPEGGTIVDVTTAASGNIYAATRSGGVFKSSDNSDSWNHIGFADTAIVDIQASATASAEIYASASGHGVFKTSDTVRSWAQSQVSTQHATTLNIDSNGKIVIGTEAGAVHYQSNDSWTSVMFPTVPLRP